MNDELKFDGCWAVTISEAGNMNIGNIVQAIRPDGHPIHIVSNESALVEMAGGALFKFEPGFEYSTPLQPTPQGGVVRKSIVLPPGLTRGGLPIYTRATAIYFLADMSSEDRKEHEDMLRSAWDTIRKSTMGDQSASPILDTRTGTDPRVLDMLRRGGKS